MERKKIVRGGDVSVRKASTRGSAGVAVRRRISATELCSTEFVALQPAKPKGFRLRILAWALVAP